MRRIRWYASPVPRNPSKREAIRAMPRFFRQGNASRSLHPSFVSRKTVLAKRYVEYYVQCWTRCNNATLWPGTYTFLNVIKVFTAFCYWSRDSLLYIPISSLHFPIVDMFVFFFATRFCSNKIIPRILSVQGRTNFTLQIFRNLKPTNFLHHL